jgi:hypothetical protein
MQISKLNKIFTTRGPAATLATAVAAQMEPWIIRKLEAGEWEPGKKSAPKPKLVETRSTVDRNGDKRLVKVSLNGNFLGYQIETIGESGEVVSRQSLGDMNLTAARNVLGKFILHPTPANAGKKTNDPTVSRSMKGSSTGGGNNKKGK